MVRMSGPELANALFDHRISLAVITAGRAQCRPGWRLPGRTIPEHLMYYAASGALDIRVGGREVRLCANSFFWFQPGIPHSITVPDAGETADVIFFRFYLGTKTAIRLRKPYIRIAQEPRLRDALLDLLPGKALPGAYAKAALRYRLGSLICRVLSLYDEKGDRSVQGLSIGQRVAALEFLQKHQATRFSLPALADVLGLNPDYVSRQFKKSFGLPPQEWVKRERIRQAAALLLESALPVTDIARSLGYEELFFFSRQFKQVTGFSPRAFRARKNP